MRTARLTSRIALTVVAFLTISACSSANTPEADTPSPPPVISTAIIEAFSGTTFDYDPVASPRELAAGSDLVVAGTVAVFQTGRELLVADGSMRHSGETIVMVIDNPRRVDGGKEDAQAARVYVEMMTSGPDGLDGFNQSMPAGTPVLVYLERAWDSAEPAGDEVLKDPAAGRPDGETLYRLYNPQSLIIQAGDDLVWPPVGGVATGQEIMDAMPDGPAIAR